MPVPNTFANATTAIPLSQLDNNFATAITLGNTAIQLGNTVTTLNNMTLANVTISSVSTPITAAQGGTGATSLTAENVVLGNGTNAVKFVAPGTNGNVLSSNGTSWVSQAPAAATGNVTIGNTTINIGGTATTVGNLTLTNATLSSLSTPVTVAQGGTGATSLTANNVILGNGTNAVQFVAPGTNGNVLSSNGTAWVSTAAAGGAGSMIYLSTVTAANSATVSVETTFDSTYDVYAIIAVDVRLENTTSLNVRLKSGGTYQTSSYNGTYAYTDSASSSLVWAAGSGSFITISNANAANVNSGQSFEVKVYNPSGTNFKKGISATGFQTSNQSANAAGTIAAGGTYGNSTAAVTGVRFLAATGNIVSGTFRLYGIKNS
jgi:hypothetical protein